MNKEAIQQVFNKVYLGLKSQGFERSLEVRESGYSQCKYRGDEGRKCAIGFLIPDEKYQKSFEKMSPDELITNAIIDVPDSYFGFLRELQSIHDHASNPEDMKWDLESYAQELGLEIPEE